MTDKGAQSVQVDIVSDIVCPWCWLGARYFWQAAQQIDIDITLNWHPYMLDPDVPTNGVPYRDYMTAKFGAGPSDKFKAMRSHLEQAGPDVGIDFRFNDIPMRPNTLNAHRLMRWAGGQDKADAMAEALFRAFFTDHKDIGDLEVLTALSADVGLDADLIASLLPTERDSEAVQAEIAHFRNLGISGVPSFIYNRQYLVQGAQPTETHLSALQKFAAPQS